VSEKNQVKIDITASASGLKKGTEEARRELGALEKEINQSGRAAQQAAGHHDAMRIAVGAVTAAAAGAGLAVGAYLAWQLKLSRAWAEGAEQVAHLAERTSLSVEELSVMRLELETSKTTLDQYATGLKNLSVKMFEANSGNKNAQVLFKSLGIEYEDGTGKLRNARDVMDEIATRFAGMEQGAGKNAIAAKLLGRGIGEDLIPYLNQGGDALKRLREEAEQTGQKVDAETAKAVKELKDNMRALELSAQGAAGELAGPFIRALRDIFEEARRASREGIWPAIFAGARAGFSAAAFDTPQQSLNKLLAQRTGMLGEVSRYQDLLDGPAQPGQRQQRQMWQEQLNQLNAGLNALQIRIETAAGIVRINEPGGITGTSPKTSAPDAALKDESERRGRAGAKQLTFDELLAKNAQKREQMIQQQEDEATRNYVRDAEARTRAEEREAEAVEKLARRYKDMIDPMEPLRRQLAEIEKLYASGKLTADEYAEAMFMIQNKMEDLNVKANEVKDAGLKELQTAIEGWGRESSREIGRMVVDGEFNLKRLGNAFKNLAADIIAMQIQRQWVTPLLGAATNWLGGLFGGGGRSGGGGASFTAPSVVAHAGYGPGDAMQMRMVSPALFANAPRFHSGRSPREVPAIIRDDESVLTPGQMRQLAPARGAPNVTVNVINQGGQQMAVERASAPRFDGQAYVIDVWLRAMRNDSGLRDQTRQMLAAPV
jgi:hypothetical protein